MSDIGILNDPWSLAVLFLIIGSPGIAVGAIAGALLWRRHRIGGAAIGAVLGFIGCLGGAVWYKAVL
jgi:hypothetical protein